MKRKWLIVGILAFFELLVCVGIVAMLGTGWSGADFEGVRFFYVTDTHVEEMIEETFAVDGPAILDLASSSDNVTVTGGAEGEVEIVAKVSMWGEDEEDARRQLDVQMIQEGNRIVIRVERPRYVNIGVIYGRSSHVDFEIRVPDETSLQLQTSSGDLSVSDVVGSAELRTSSGGIKAEDVSGAVEAHASSGDITLTGLSSAGDVAVETSSGDVVLRGVEGDSLTVRASSGDQELDDLSVTGDVEVRTSSGDVVLGDVASRGLVVHTSSGKIELEGGVLSGGLDLETVSGRVTVVGVRAASYRLAASSGDVRLDGCGGRLDLRTVSGGIEVKNAAEAVLEVETSSGGLDFSGSLGAEGDHRIRSVSGNVRLILPADAAFDLDVETVSGSIDTDFAVTMTQFDKRHVAGEVNGGGPSLQISTSSGDVALVGASGGSD